MALMTVRLLSFLALIRNTTIGINSIVSSLGNKIKGTLILSHVYAAMRNTMDLHRIEIESSSLFSNRVRRAHGPPYSLGRLE